MSYSIPEHVDMGVETELGQPPVVRSWGEIDLSNADKLKSALDDAVTESPEGIIVDLTAVTYVDSAGVQMVLWAYQALRRLGDRILVLVLGQNEVRTIFDLIHPELLPGFRVVDSVEAGREVFK